ncbi:terpenoid synthase [Byssothecium circinans]|uniref:Terpenoid synthase n=1 Tax=Byssothecium circinans TaxID=147558 RepID=A0A6A5UE16_9PLEO|nr:terpenoid synthase [Byssothecium circinans]
MDFKHSKKVPLNSYETHGLACGILLRMHKDPWKETRGALRAQKDWSEKVRPVVDYKGGLGDPYSFIRLTVPECLPERLEIISYANEYAFLYDDEMEKLGVQTGYEDYEMLDAFGDRALSSKVDPNTRPEKRIQAQILSEMTAIDPERAVTTMKAWARFVQLASQTPSRPFETLNEYLPSRIIDAGELFWFGTLTFAMGLTIPDEEMDLCMKLAQPGYAAISLANDLYSWEKERDAAEKQGVGYVFNAVWVLMQERSTNEDEALILCAEETKRYISEFQRIVRDTKNDLSLSRDLRAYIEAVNYSYVGNLVWSIYCPRLRSQGKVSIVTGRSSGVGYELVKNCIGNVYVAGRSEEKAWAAIRKIQSAVNKDGNLNSLFLELDDLSSIKASVDGFKRKESKLHVLWHNAGVSQPLLGSVSK